MPKTAHDYWPDLYSASRTSTNPAQNGKSLCNITTVNDPDIDCSAVSRLTTAPLYLFFLFIFIRSFLCARSAGKLPTRVPTCRIRIFLDPDVELHQPYLRYPDIPKTWCDRSKSGVIGMLQPVFARYTPFRSQTCTSKADIGVLIIHISPDDVG